MQAGDCLRLGSAYIACMNSKLRHTPALLAPLSPALLLLALLLLALLLLASGCAATGQGRAADPNAAPLSYQPNPQADPDAAARAVILLAPKLTVPGANDSRVSAHVTKGLVVFRLDSSSYEYQEVDRPPLYATGYPYCSHASMMDDCSWPQTMRVKVEHTDQVVVDPASISAMEFFSDNRMRLVHDNGRILELNAPDRGVLLDLADALAGLAEARTE